MSNYLPKIKIKNLMGVKECDFTIKQFMVLIGEQSTGKSTICKAIYYMQKFPEILTQILQNLAMEGNPEFSATTSGFLDEKSVDNIIKSTYKEHKDLFFDIFGIAWGEPKLELKYYFGKEFLSKDYYLKVVTPHKERALQISVSATLRTKINHCVRDVWQIYISEMRDSSSLQKSKRQNQINHQIEEMVNKIFSIDQNIVYIPAGRSLLTLTSQQGGIKLDSLDYITSEFVRLTGTMRKRFHGGHPIPETDEPNHAEADKYAKEMSAFWEHIEELLKGEYHVVNGQERLQLNNEKQDLPLNYTSSGQQEMLWVLNSLYLWALEREKLFVIIEEPEAHLFPAAQKKMMEIIARFINLTGSTVLITTHSPYILTAANNQIFAQQVSTVIQNANNAENQEQLNQLVDKAEYIDGDSFGAWYVGGENYFEDITTTPDYREIDATRIDQISQSINRMYGELYSLLPEGEQQ